jgi:hypothetical protein
VARCRAEDGRVSSRSRSSARTFTSIAVGQRNESSTPRAFTNPTWEQITAREYDSWERDRIVVDTAILTVEESAELVRAIVEG